MLEDRTKTCHWAMGTRENGDPRENGTGKQTLAIHNKLGFYYNTKKKYIFWSQAYPVAFQGLEVTDTLTIVFPLAKMK